MHKNSPRLLFFCPHGSLTVFQCGVAAGLAGQRRKNCQRLQNTAPFGQECCPMRCGGTNGAKSFCSFPLSSHAVSPSVTRTNKKGFCVGKSLFCACCAFTLGDFVCLSRQASKVISAQCVFVGRVLPRAAVGKTNLNRLSNRRPQTQTTTKDNKNAFQADSVNVSRKRIRRYRQTN